MQSANGLLLSAKKSNFLCQSSVIDVAVQLGSLVWEGGDFVAGVDGFVGVVGKAEDFVRGFESWLFNGKFATVQFERNMLKVRWTNTKLFLNLLTEYINS